MRRQREKEPEGNPAAIILSDVELRTRVPVCRTDQDTYLETMWGKIEWIKRLKEKYGCPIFDGGDLTDKDIKKNPNHLLLARAIASLPSPWYTVPGNHDLPGKSMLNYENSAMAVLERAGVVDAQSLFTAGGIIDITQMGRKVEFLPAYKVRIHRFPWGGPLEKIKAAPNCWNVVLVHAMVYNRKLPFPGCEGYEAEELLDLWSNADLIVCGHHHQTFTRSKRKTILVNPGSMMRNDADQADHRPCVFLWYPEGDFPKVRQVFIPIKKGVVSREHLDDKQELDSRLSAFVEKLGTQDMTGVDFEKNLEIALTKNIPPGIIDKVWKYFER
jgi:DNA repair exonuclease SbcCD nuclease subunit